MSAYIGRCRAGHTVRTTAAQVNAGGGWVACGCGLLTVPTALKAMQSTRKCSDICTGATSPKCSCQCAGANHGTANIYQPPTTTEAGTK